MTRHILIAVAASIAWSLSALAEEDAPASQPDMAELMKAMGAMMSGGTNAAAVVDFRELKALLPETLDGMKRTNAGGEKSGALGMTIATAEGLYETEDGGAISIKISDNGGMGGLMAFAQAGWAAGDFERESDTEFDRTVKYGDNKAHEKYDKVGKSGVIEILVAGRFMVELSGSNVTWESLQGAAKKIDLAKLATLKPADKPAP